MERASRTLVVQRFIASVSIIDLVNSHTDFCTHEQRRAVRLAHRARNPTVSIEGSSTRRLPGRSQGTAADGTKLEHKTVVEAVTYVVR